MIIKIDIDGVIRNTFQGMLDVYNREFDDYKKLADITSYDTDKSFPRIQKELGIPGNKFFFELNGKEVFSSEPLPGAIEAINRLHDAGHEISICSHQPKVVGRETTIDFLDGQQVKYDSLHFTQNKWQVYGDVIIDDNPDFLHHARETAFPIGIRYPFNKDITWGVWRKNLSEAVDWIFIHQAKIK